MHTRATKLTPCDIRISIYVNENHETFCRYIPHSKGDSMAIGYLSLTLLAKGCIRAFPRAFNFSISMSYKRTVGTLPRASLSVS